MSNEKEVLPDITNIKSTESYTLPSKGLVYRPEDNIPASITLRRMTTKEDKIRMRNTSENNIRKAILQECIMEKDVDAGKLTLTDANFLLFKLRVLSLLDDTYKIRCRCPHCGTEFIHEIKLSEVPVTYLSKDTVKKLKTTLPISGINVEFRFPSLNVMIRAGEQLEEWHSMYPDKDVTEYLYTKSRALYIEKLNGKKVMSMEAEDWMDTLDIIDSRALNDVIDTLDGNYGFVEDLIAKCPMCSEDVRHGLPITAELFTPSKRSEIDEATIIVS